MTEPRIPKDLPEWMDPKMFYPTQIGSPPRAVTFVGERGIDRVEFLNCVRIVRDFIDGRKTFGKGHCQPDYGELARQVESWPRCSICGGYYFPENEFGRCHDLIRHLKIDVDNRTQNGVPRCEYCSSAIVEDPNSKRRMRKDRRFCSTSCRVMESRKRKEHRNSQNHLLTDNSKGGLEI